MKKVLLKSVAALAVAATVVTPVFANFDAEAYNNQTEFVSARTVEQYLAGHQAEIEAEAAADSAVVAAKAAFDAVEGGSHRYGELKAAYDAAFNTAYLNVRNKYVAQFQKVQNDAKKKEGNYYILNETPEQKNARYLAEQGANQVQPENPSNPTQPSDGRQAPTEEQRQAAQGAAAQAGKAEAGTRAAANGNAKTLPKTHAAK